MPVKLTILRGPNNGKIYEFDKDIINIGSGRNNDLIIRDNDVSVNHCRLMRIEKDYDIEEMKSRFGTYVNGQKLGSDDKWLLQSGSIIELGAQVTIEYRLVVDGEEVETQPIFLDKNDPGSQPCLVLVDDGEIKEAYLLQSEDITIGRSVGNDIVIQANDISRTHVRLIWQENGFWLRDMKSRNGTFLNEISVSENEDVELTHSDVIRLGASTNLHFVFRADLPSEWDPITPDGVDKSKRETDEHTMPFAAAVHKDRTRELGMDYDEGKLNDHILLVYAREDWENIVAPIVLNLDDAKQKVWVDQHLRPNSDGWRNAIHQAQTECWLLVVIVSEEAMKTQYVKDVYRYFYNREKPIILVDYSPVEKLPFQLAKTTRIVFDRESPGKMFRRLLLEIMQLKPRYVSGNT